LLLIFLNVYAITHETLSCPSRGVGVYMFMDFPLNLQGLAFS